MKLLLKRNKFLDDRTLGELYIDGVYFCKTLEDKVRPQKIQNETAIPAGTYNVIVNESPKFKRFLPRLLDVPNFSGVLIHAGNTPADTQGCVLVGESYTSNNDLFKSKIYEEKLVEILQKNGNKHSIEIVEIKENK
jgi:hypothetical protein